MIHSFQAWKQVIEVITPGLEVVIELLMIIIIIIILYKISLKM